MLNLSELVFKVQTDALVDAAKKVADLGKSVDDLSSTFSKLEKSSSQASKAQAKAERDLAAAEVDRAKAADIAAKTEERKSKAVRDTAKATEEATVVTKSSVSILERQQAILEFQANGYSKGQASILAYAKAAGVAASEIQEIGKVLQAQRTLMGGDPFDKSLGSLKSLQNEFKTLKEVQRLYTAEIPLTRKQMENLALDKLRLIEAMKIEGRSMSEIKTAIKDLNVKYITTAQNINRVTQAEDKLDKARKDSANANAFLEKEMQRVNFALQTQNNELNKGTANALNRFEQNLKRSGLTLDQQRVKMEEYRKGLLALEKTKGGNTDYITRALGPQITDIFVGLATGQAPLTVMLQQGGQLRDQFALAGVAAEDMGKTMRTAAKDMVVSVAAVAKAFGDLLLGAFIDTGKGIVNLIGNVTGLNKVLEYARYQLTLFAMADPSFGGPLLKLFNGLRIAVIGFAATMAATGVGALIAMVVALKQVISENDTLAKSLALSGGALGISQSSAIEYVKSLGEVGVTTGKATEAITEMAKAGVFAKEDILLVGKAAADMSTYAGVGVDDTVKHFAKLKEKPVEALLDIAKATGMVAPEILKMVIELEKSGRSADAAALAMKTYGDVTATQVAQMKENYNSFSLFIIELGKGIKQFFSDTFKTLFLATDPTEQLRNNLAKLQERIKEVKENQATNSFFGIKADNTLLNNLQEQERQLLKNLDRQVANNQAKEQESVINAANARIEAAKFKMFEGTEDKLDKQLKKTKTLGEWQTFYVDKQIEKLAKEANVNKDQIKLTDEQIEKTKELAKVEWDRAQKKGKKDPTENYFAALMREATNATIKADEATQDLTKSQIKMLEVIADPRFAKLTENEKSRVLNTYAQAAADEKIVSGQELINKMLGKGEGLGKEYYKTLKELESLKGNAGIDQEELEKALQALRDTTPAARKAKAEIEAAAKAYNEYAAAAQTIKDSVAAENNQLDFRMSLLGKTSEEQRKMTIEHERTLKLLEAEAKYQKEILKIRNDTRLQADPLLMAKALQDTEEAFAEQRKAINRGVAVAFAEDLQKEIDQVRNGITDSIVTALFEGGKAGAKKFRDVIVNVLRQKVTIVVDAVVNTLLGSVIGGLFGGGSAVGGGGSNALSLLNLAGAAKNLFSVGSQFFSGAMSSSNALGTVFANATGTGIDGLLATNGAFGTASSGGGLLGGIQAAALPAAVAAVVLNGLGAFRSERKVAGGLMGTLGSGPINAWEEWRQGGTLFSGPSYNTFNPTDELSKAREKLNRLREAGDLRNLATQQMIVDNLEAQYGGLAEATAKQSKVIQTAYEAMRTNAAKMADTLGIASANVKTFTTQLGGEKGINFEGLNAEQQQAKLAEALANANNELAMQLIGTWEKTFTTVTKVVATAFGQGEEGSIAQSFEEVSTVIEGAKYTNSVYAKEGEKAIDTLTRLATSLSNVNAVFDTLGYTLYSASLAGGDMASKLVDLFGSLENFNASTTSYYENYYTEAEKQATLVRQLTKAFGDYNLALPSTRDAFRQIVESQDLTTEAGREMFKNLMGLQNPLNELFKTFENLDSSVVELSNTVLDEVRRLRGLTESTSTAGGIAKLEQQFLQTANKAKGGDLSAFEDLAKQSQVLDQSYLSSAGTAAEYELRKAMLVNTLLATDSSLRSGTVTAYTPSTSIPSQPMVQTPSSASSANQQSAASVNLVVLELQALRGDVDQLRAEVRADVAHNARIARILERVTPDGDSIAISNVQGETLDVTNVP